MLTLDAVDRGLIHALHLDARATFTKIAGVLGTSTQTVVRRYQRLRRLAGLRVVGLADPHRSHRQQWIVRFTAAPRAAQDIAAALAGRPDTAWVRLTSGGTEIVAVVQTAPGGADSHALLLRDIPRTASVSALSAHYLLHSYLGGPTAWWGRVNALDEDQQRRLLPRAPGRDPDGPVALTDVDQHLLTMLGRDGRASYAQLAAATGSSASTVARRLDELRDCGVLFFDVEVDDLTLGATVSTLLWMTVQPAHLHDVATSLAGHPELAVVAATTGRTNLLATVLTPDTEALHRYLTSRLAIPAITSMETAPILRTLKAVAPIRSI